jgi:uncharacterized membrane protein YvbJ
MPFCRYCRTEYIEGANFCQKCGANLTARLQRSLEPTVSTGYKTSPSLNEQFKIDCKDVPASVIIRKLIAFYHKNKALIDHIKDPHDELG